jgi:iron complex transport system ATP-binding protein
VTSISVEGVSVAFDGTTVLNAVHLDVPAGTWVGLIGPNGAGKTTLLRSMAGLIPFRGTVRIDGDELRALARRQVARRIAYVPQRPRLPMGLAVVEYVLMGRSPYIPYLGSERRHDLEVVAAVLHRMELSAMYERRLESLSGGEVQRAILARALAQEAPVMLLDEPTSALDVGHQQRVLELVDELREERGLTVLSAMHDLTLAAQFAERLVLLAGGRAVAAGPARSVLTEGAIREHYGATVRVLESPDGGVLVIPTRLRQEVASEEPSAGSGDP